MMWSFRIFSISICIILLQWTTAKKALSNSLFLTQFRGGQTSQDAPRSSDATKITVRVRLPDGSLRKSTIDATHSTAEGSGLGEALLELVQRELHIDPKDSTATTGNQQWKASCLAAGLKDVPLDRLQSAQIQDLKTLKVIDITVTSSISSTVANTTNSSSSSTSSTRPTPSKSSSKTSTSKGGVFTLADIAAERNRLLRIKRQKYDAATGLTVLLSPETERIMHRLSQHGGLAILGGTIQQAQPLKKSTKKSTKVSDSATQAQEVLVLTAFELHTGTVENNHNLLKQCFSSVPAIISFMETCGMTAVGVALGHSEEEEEFLKENWTPTALTATLTLKDLTTINSTIFLSVSEKNTEATVDPALLSSKEKAALQNKKKISKKAKKTLGMGKLGVEPYKLSDQALELSARGTLLPSYNCVPKAQKTLESKKISKKNVKNSKKTEEIDSTSDEDAFKYELAGPVLWSSKEVTAIDCRLFAVPLPIRGFHGHKMNGVRSFLHIFPTPQEYRSDSVKRVEADKFVLKLVKRVSSGRLDDDSRECLRDIHLLWHLKSLLSGSVFTRLLQYVKREEEVVPTEVKLEMSLLVQSLEAQLGLGDFVESE